MVKFCPKCGSEMRWSNYNRGLICPDCGYVEKIDGMISIFEQFIDKFDIADLHRQMRCIKEELCEFMFEYVYPENKNYGSRREREELADLVITCRVFAEM